MKRFILSSTAIATLALLVGCGGGGAGSAGGPGIGDGSPIVSTFSPGTLKAGSPTTVVTITGANYLNGAVVTFEGQPRPTTELNIRQLQVQLDASDLATPGTYQIVVQNPDGNSSKPKSFVVAP